jgi:hypothetical protein
MASRGDLPGVVSILTLGAGLAAVFAGVENWWPALLFG